MTQLRIDKIKIEWRPEEYADLSHLEHDGETPGDPREWAHVTDAQVRKSYRHHHPQVRFALYPGRKAATVELDEIAYKQDADRLESYGSSWCMESCRAVAVVSYPTSNRGDRRLERFTSGGLYGIESDSDDSYRRSVESEELDQLRDHLEQFGVELDNFDQLAQEAQH